MVGRWAITGKSMVTTFMQQKVIAAVVFLVCLTLAPGLWYFVVAVIACTLLLAKFSAMARVEAGGPLLPPVVIRRSFKRTIVASLTFGLLWSFAPFVVLSQVQLGPESWSGFAGLGLGTLLTYLSFPK